MASFGQDNLISPKPGPDQRQTLRIQTSVVISFILIVLFGMVVVMTMNVTSTSTSTPPKAVAQINGSSHVGVNASESVTLTSRIHNVTTPIPNEDTSSSATVGIVVTIVVILIFVGGAVVVWACLKRGKCRHWQFSWRCCWWHIKHRKPISFQSTSRGPLTEDDNASVDIAGPRNERELFAIGNQDGDADRPTRRTRIKRETNDDYFYDEIFEKSAFEDETTKASNTQLTLDDGGDEFDIPDLIMNGWDSQI